jgi:MFS family permease
MLDQRWRILSVLFLARTAMGFQFQSVASTTPLLMTDLHIDYGGIGSLIGFYMVPGIVVAFPSGLLMRRFGDKRLCVAGLTLMVLGGILLGLGHTVAAAFAGRIVSGAGSVIFSLVLTKMATDWFAGREIIFAMGVVLASWPFGIAAGLLVQPALAASEGWRWVMYEAAALCGIALFLIIIGYRDPPRAVAPMAGAARLPMLPPLRQLLPTTVASLMWGNLNLTLVLFFSFAPAAMTELGLSAITSAAWVSAALWIIMLSVPLGGLGVQRSGRTDAAIVVFSALAGIALALLPSRMGALAGCVVFGLAIGPPAGAIMALPSRVLSPEHRAGGLGAFMTVYYVILSLGPALAGVLREHSGTAAAAVWLASGLMLSTALLMGIFNVTAKGLTNQGS